MSFTSPAHPAAPAAVKSLFSRDSLIVAAALALAALLAWAWLLRSSAAGMSAMAAPEPLSPAYLLPAFAMWTIMMVAMMVPSAMPMSLLHARIDRAPSEARRKLHSALLIGGYLLVWTAFSMAAAIAQALLVGSGAVSAGTLALGSRPVAAGLLLVAAIYELTAAKALCLDKCRAPMLFILKHWTPGPAGTLRLGLLHGLYCVGCCWALMLLLFVGGVTNLAWVALLGIVVLGEKLAPPTWRANRYVAAALMCAAVALLV